MTDFKEYQSKPITRKAYEVKSLDEITKIGVEATSSINGSLIFFKHYEPVKVGDFIVYLNDSDIYHCDRGVFIERNIVPSEETDNNVGRHALALCGVVE